MIRNLLLIVAATAAVSAFTPTAVYAAESTTEAPQGPSSSERAGQGLFDAKGEIPCSASKGQPMGQCQFAVARDPGGNATVKITLADGRSRFIFFENGSALSADLSQADGDMTFEATKEGDLFMIRAGEERYEIPEAVVFGG